MIDDWIDNLCDVFRIDVPGFKSTQVPYLVKEQKFPATINPVEDFPIALVIPDGLNPYHYGVGSPKLAFWSGVTQIHVAPDLSMAWMPQLTLWYGRIYQAVTSGQNPTLNGKVELFWVEPNDDAIAGPLSMQYHQETPHWGFLVQWKVKEPVGVGSQSTIQISVSMP